MAKLFPSKEHRIALLTRLRTLGTTSVLVTFSGSGDSGNIDEAELYVGAEGKRMAVPHGEVLDWVSYESRYNPNASLGESAWTRVETPVRMELGEVLKNMVADALEESMLDWYNNDGGQGQLLIDFTTSPPTINLEVGINITTTDEHSFDFTDDDEE